MIELFKPHDGDDYEMQKLRVMGTDFMKRLTDKGASLEDIGRIWASLQPMFDRPVITTPPVSVAIGDAESFAYVRYLVEHYDERHSQEWKLVKQHLDRVTNASYVSIGITQSRTQRKKAGQPRGKLNDEGDTITSIISALVNDPENSDCTAVQLWPKFIGKLDYLECNPKEIKKRDSIEYDNGKKIVSFKFTSFISAVSKVRKK